MKKIALLVIVVCMILFPCWSEKFSNSYIEIDVPDELEVQNETWGALGNLVRTGSTSSDVAYQLVLQQDGLNALQNDAWNNYCRVMVTVFDLGLDGYSNMDFEDEMEAYSSQKLDEIYDSLETSLIGNYEVIERYDRNVKYIDGKYALHLSLLRKPAIEGQGDVYVDCCYFVVNGYMFCVTKSYRFSQKDYYAPIVDKAVASLRILLDDAEDNIGKVYEQSMPWISSTFLWPEETIEWKTTTSSDGSKKETYFSDVDNLGITYQLAFLNFNYSVSKTDQNELLKQFKIQAVSGIRNKLKNYNLSITKNTISNGVIYIDYTYTFSGIKIYGTMYSRFADSKRFISTAGESLYTDDSVVADINESLGF